MLKPHQTIAAALLGAAVLCAPAQARAPFDGEWSVVIVTEQNGGSCDQAYRYPVRISDGVIRYADDTAGFTASGAVTASGAIKVRLARGDAHADGAGKLSGKFGSGRWTSATAKCGGRWQAERRG